jgi:hypothetical protein
MKKIAKKLLLLAVLLTFLFSLPACGSKLKNSQYLGSWKGTTAEYAGIEMTVDDVVGETMITFEANGSCSVTSNGSTESGSWEETDTGVSIDGGNLEMTLTDGKLVMTMDGVTVYFEKQSADETA